MSTYKFIYFNATAKGEISRLLLFMGGQKFEDVRVNFEEWAKMKPTTPFGQVPILEVDGVKLSQSRAIERLLAKRFGLYGKNDIEQAQADMIRDYLSEVRDGVEKMMGPLRFNKDQKKYEEIQKEFLNEKCPKFFENLNKLVNDKGVFVGSEISWVDLELFCLIQFTVSGAETDVIPLLAKYPKLNALYNKVANSPKVKDYLKNRPQSLF